MRVLALLQLLAAAAASRLDLSARDLCKGRDTIVVLSAKGMSKAPPCCASFRKLFVHRNLIRQLPDQWLQPCPHLQELSVSQNALRQLPDRLLESASSLRRFQASRNQLDSLPPTLLHNATSLQELDLSHNQLRELPAILLETTTRLAELYLQGNQLESLPEQLLGRCGALRRLSLAGNGLHTLPPGLLAAAPRLHTLRLDHNQLAHLHSDALANNLQLRVVDLSSNNLTSFPAGLLANATLLRYLLLNNNQLGEAPGGDSLPGQPISLDLRHNHLQTVQNFRVFGSSRVWLDGNKWHCGCSLAPVLAEANSVRQSRWFQQRPVCYVDGNYKNRRSFSEENVAECHKSSVDSGGSTEVTAAVHGPVPALSHKSSGEAVLQATTPNAATSDTESSTPHIRNVEARGPNSVDPESTTSEVGSSETGDTVTYSPEAAVSTIFSTGYDALKTSNREITTLEPTNAHSEGFTTSETYTSEISTTETDAAVVSTTEIGTVGPASSVAASTTLFIPLAPEPELDLSNQEPWMTAFSTTDNNSATVEIAASSSVNGTSDVNSTEEGGAETENLYGDFPTE